MKADQQITKQEIHLTRLALQLAMKDAGETPLCDWLSSRQGCKPQSLEQVLGGSGYYKQKGRIR